METPFSPKLMEKIKNMPAIIRTGKGFGKYCVVKSYDQNGVTVECCGELLSKNFEDLDGRRFTNWDIQEMEKHWNMKKALWTTDGYNMPDWARKNYCINHYLYTFPKDIIDGIVELGSFSDADGFFKHIKGYYSELVEIWRQIPYKNEK
jgi:hypothetical protein